MTRNNVITCAYCKVQNPIEAQKCVACGAPLEKPPAPKKESLQPASKILSHPILEEKKSEEIAQKIAEKAEDAYYVYAIGWRTLGEALAIAVAAFIVGVASGATGLGFWGLLGGAAIGITVGLTWKNFYIAVISAPLGAIIGIGAGILPLIFGWPKALPITIMLFAIIGARLGGRPRPNFKHRNWWEKTRPFLGALGGIFFSLLGVLLGLGIEKIISRF